MSVFDFEAENLRGDTVDLKNYQGKVVLVVNTASACGYTPQYQGLETLYRDYKDQGLEILAFPCNQFGKQESGDAQAIGAFCEKNFGVSFPIFAKIDVNGKNAHPFFRQLKTQARGLLGSKTIKWNFTKFLIKKDGTVLKRYAPQTTPEDLRAEIERLLKE